MYSVRMGQVNEKYVGGLRDFSIEWGFSMVLNHEWVELGDDILYTGCLPNYSFEFSTQIKKISPSKKKHNFWNINQLIPYYFYM